MIVKHSFSIEMHSKEFVKSITVSNESQEQVLFEGFLGELLCLKYIEGMVLTVIGTNGIIRIDLSEEELLAMLKNREEKTK